MGVGWFRSSRVEGTKSNQEVEERPRGLRLPGDLSVEASDSRELKLGQAQVLLGHNAPELEGANLLMRHSLRRSTRRAIGEGSTIGQGRGLGVAPGPGRVAQTPQSPPSGPLLDAGV